MALRIEEYMDTFKAKVRELAILKLQLSFCTRDIVSDKFRADLVKRITLLEKWVDANQPADTDALYYFD